MTDFYRRAVAVTPLLKGETAIAYKIYGDEIVFVTSIGKKYRVKAETVEQAERAKKGAKK